MNEVDGIMGGFEESVRYATEMSPSGDGVDVSQQKFVVAHFFGQTALYTDYRVDRTTVPESLYVYELREDDDRIGEPCEAGKHVAPYFMGTVICREPIELDDDGLRKVDPEKDFREVEYSGTIEDLVAGKLDLIDELGETLQPEKPQEAPPIVQMMNPRYVNHSELERAGARNTDEDMDMAKLLVNSYRLASLGLDDDEVSRRYSNLTKVPLVVSSTGEGEPDISVSVYADLKHDCIYWYAGQTGHGNEGLVDMLDFTSTKEMSRWLGKYSDPDLLVKRGQEVFKCYDRLSYDELADKLYFRFSAENDIYACYLTENCSPDEIYSLSRESLVRADIVDSLEDRSFELPGEEELRNLLKSGVSLDDAYNAYETVDNHADLYLSCEEVMSYLSDSLKEAEDREAMLKKQEIPNGVAGYAKTHKDNSERHEEKNAER